MVDTGQPHTADFRIRLLGGFAVEREGRVLLDRTWRRSKARALVKLLALQPSRSLHRDQVIEALWPHLDAGAAENQLHKNIHYLRQALHAHGGEGLVRLAGPLVALDAGAEIDAARFAEAARVALTAQPPDLAALEQSLARYTGELLPEDQYEAWCEQPRNELAALARALGMAMAREWMALEDWERAIAVLKPLVSADPCDEEAQALIISSYVLIGDRARAVRQYNALRDTLARDFDVDPSPRVQALAERYGLAPEGLPEQQRPDRHPTIERTRAADGVEIAYWRLGQGPPFVQLPMGMLSHIAMEMDLPWMRGWYQRLAERRAVIRYDMRGFGSSERCDHLISFESQVLDLAAVMDRLSEPAVVFATLAQGRVALRYAAEQPHRVSHLILWSSQSPGPEVRIGEEEQNLFWEGRHRDWRTFINAWAIAIWGWERADQARLWARVQFDASSPDALDALQRADEPADVRAVLPAVTIPTLIVAHRRFPGSLHAATELAAGIPHAHVEVLNGVYAPWTDRRHTDEALPIIERFLSDGSSPSKRTTPERRATPPRFSRVPAAD